MNILNGILEDKRIYKGLTLYNIRVADESFRSIMVSTDEGEDPFQIGGPVRIVFKETEVAIARGLSGGISLRNRFFAKVTELNKGVLISRITMDYKGQSVCSVITSASVNKLDVKLGDEVECLIKTNEISLEEC